MILYVMIDCKFNNQNPCIFPSIYLTIYLTIFPSLILFFSRVQKSSCPISLYDIIFPTLT